MVTGVVLHAECLNVSCMSAFKHVTVRLRIDSVVGIRHQPVQSGDILVALVQWDALNASLLHWCSWSMLRSSSC